MPDGRTGEERETPSPDEVSWALHRLVVSAAALDVTLGRRLDLGPSEYQAMKHLMTAGRPLGPVELGALVGLTSGSATTLVDRLERAGHLARRRDPHDRRRLTLEPTPEALRDARRQLRPLEDSLNDVLATYSTEERRTIARFLTDVVAAYRHFNGDTAASRPGDSGSR
ncbi:MarR family winged helix-turn-helix transcriptional regulator [Streptosporangium sp. NPDC048865]|uniref:MarR family winged helix-turn-helix transcriptional regulator n=1 Tax=Streptosporangium sp. NPDC048865 TaxID=3155766 RepID=UPI00344665B7